MELDTIVVKGVEYVLVPKDLFEKSIGVESEPSEVEDVPVESDNSDQVIISSTTGVKKADGKTYGYKERLDKHSLLPEDIMVLKNDFDVMPETPEIARNDSRNKIPAGKWGFYGPGAERDLG